MIHIHYLQDVNENIHHFDVAFYRVSFRILLLTQNGNKNKTKSNIKRKEKSMQKTEISNKNEENIKNAANLRKNTASTK